MCNSALNNGKHCDTMDGKYRVVNGFVQVPEADYNKLCAVFMTVYQSGARLLGLPPLLTHKQQKRIAAE